MNEGWYNDDYLILFEGSEIEQKGQEYVVMEDNWRALEAAETDVDRPH